jgi:acetyl-CoA carboxylase/biotin carboxylase 1
LLPGEKFSVEVTKAGPQMLSLRLNGSSIDIVSRKLNDGGLLIQLDGVSHVVHAEEEPSGTRLTIDTSTCLLSNEHDPSQLKALSTGKLIRYLVEDGDHLESNAAYAEIEVMKMVMTLLTPAAGVITFELPEGSVLTPGNLIARLKLDDPASVRMATPFVGQWPELGPPVVRADGVEKRFLEAMTNADNILAGYPNSVDNTVNTLWEAVNDPVLGLVQWNEAYSVVSSRIPMQLAAQLETIADDCAADLEDTKKMKLEQDCSAITAASMIELLDAMAKGIDDAAEDDRPGLVQLLEPLQAVARDHSQGLEAYAMKVAKRLMDNFLEVEEHFQTTEGMTEQEVIDSMRKSYASDLQSVVDMALSHNGLSLKTDLIRRILSTFVVSKPDQYRKQLRRLASLYDRRALTLALEAQKLLEDSLLGELRNIVGRVLSGEDIGIAPVDPVRTESLGAPGRRMTVTEGLFAGLTNLTSPSMQSASVEDRISMLVEAPAAVEDALALLLLDDQELEISQKALRTYIKRLYHPYMLVEPQLDQNESMMLASWAFEDQAAAETTSSKECVGGAFTVTSLKEIAAVLKAFNSSKACSSLKAGLCRGTLHIVLLGHEERALCLAADAAQELEKLDQDAIEQIKRVDGDTIDPRQLAASFLAQIRSLSSEILASGFSSVSLLSKRGNLSPLKTALYFSQTENQFVLDPVLCRMEPPTARCLESEKLISFPKASYSCSRNRQWHIYSACEGNGRSIALKRVFARGIVRQIGRPDLLAATYSGNSAAAAAAAVQELQDSIQSAISELDRAGTFFLKNCLMDCDDRVTSFSIFLQPIWERIHLVQIGLIFS